MSSTLLFYWQTITEAFLGIRNFSRSGLNEKLNPRVEEQKNEIVNDNKKLTKTRDRINPHCCAHLCFSPIIRQSIHPPIVYSPPSFLLRC
ncbi:hypothetical protein Hanom_Chr09g00856441 [Helianthus anomalus]